MTEHAVFAAVARVGRNDLSTVAAAAEHADDTLRLGIETANDFSLDFPVFATDQPGQCALADRQFLSGAVDQSKARRLAIPGPGDRSRQRGPVRIAAKP